MMPKLPPSFEILSPLQSGTERVVRLLEVEAYGRAVAEACAEIADRDDHGDTGPTSICCRNISMRIREAAKEIGA